MKNETEDIPDPLAMKNNFSCNKMQANEKQSKFDIRFDKLNYSMNSCKEIQNQFFLFTRREHLRRPKKKT